MIYQKLQSVNALAGHDDGTKQYMLKSQHRVWLTQEIVLDVRPEEGCETIFELKSAEKSLEDAFITIIDENTKKRRAEAEAAEKARRAWKRAKRRE